VATFAASKRTNESVGEIERQIGQKEKGWGKRTATPYWYSATSCGDNWATCA